MVTRFRVEAEGDSRQKVEEELISAVSEFSKLFRMQNGNNGHWECTDDVIYRDSKQFVQHGGSDPIVFEGNYKGRMVMVYRRNNVKDAS